MAYFMLNDRPDFFEQGLNTLEKLTHQYHMHEIYAAAAPIYNKMKENPPSDLELCGCVNDITGNGILIEMANIARQLQYFQSKRMSRNLQAACSIREYIQAYRGYGCGRQKRDAEDVEFDESQIAELEEEYLVNPTHETAYDLLQAKPWKGNSLVRFFYIINCSDSTRQPTINF